MSYQNALEKIFGSQARLRLLRLFLFNPQEIFDMALCKSRARLTGSVIKKEVNNLYSAGYIKRGTRVTTVEEKNRKKLRRKKILGYTLDKSFPYLNEIAALLGSHTPFAREKLTSNIKNAGKVNLVVIAGELLGEERDYVDAFVVGDGLKKSKIDRLLGALEAEMGRELVYAFMTTKEFESRYGLHDRFLQTLFDNPHELLINKLGISRAS